MITFSVKEYIIGKYGFGLIEEVVCVEEKILSLVVKRNDETMWRRKFAEQTPDLQAILSKIARRTLDAELNELNPL